MREYSPADNADHAERMQQAALFRRERQFVASGGWGVMCFWVLSAIICVICERIGRSHIRKEQGKSKERARNEQGINEHVSSQLCCINMNSIVFTMRQLSFVCEIMQLAAFLCVICAICGRITRKSTQSICTNETPMSPADFADLRRQNLKPQQPH